MTQKKYVKVFGEQTVKIVIEGGRKQYDIAQELGVIIQRAVNGYKEYKFGCGERGYTCTNF